MLDVLQRIHRDQQERGRRPKTEEEMVAEIAPIPADEDLYEERGRQSWSRIGIAPERPDKS